MAEPERWERHLRRRGDSEAGEAAPPAPAAEVALPAPAAAEEEEDDARSSHGDPEEEFFGFDGPPGRESASRLSGQGEDDRTTGTASGPGGRDSEPSPLVQRLCAVDVCEVFSPPRVGLEAAKFGLKVGDAFDLTTGWDFNIPEHRREAEERVDRDKPLVLIGSPPCVAFSPLQTLNPNNERKAMQFAEGIRHMECVAKLYRKQIEGDRVFLHENPARAKSWALPCIRRVA